MHKMASIVVWFLFATYGAIRLYILGAVELIRQYLVLFNRWIQNEYFEVELGCGNGQHVLVTGGLTGIGYETVKGLLQSGARVSVVGKAPYKSAQSILQDMTLDVGVDVTEVNYYQVDLSDMLAVTQFAKRLVKSDVPLHTIICNAGIMHEPYRLTVDNFESQWQVNYLSHVVIITFLTSLLVRSSTPLRRSRIVWVASCCHKADFIRFSDPSCHGSPYSPHLAYGQSKIAAVMFCLQMQKALVVHRLPLNVYVVHPGVVNTQLYRNVWWARFINPFFLISPRRGCETSLFTALSPFLENSGGSYLEFCRIVRPSPFAMDDAMQLRLWKLTWSEVSKFVDPLDFDALAC